jgi:methionyl-tRNA formyltransferase
MKIVFMGTPEFAVPTLRSLFETAHEVAAVVTQPDRPKGRGRKLTPSPVKVLAEHYHAPVLQPAKVRKNQKFHEQLRALAPDVIVVAAYGQILPEAVLQIPPQGCINVHASLLPKYRGAAPMHWAIIRGERETGITTMLMDKGMDTGDMLLQQPAPITEDDTVGTLHDTLSEVGARLLAQTLRQIEHGTLTPTPQDDAAATYAPLLTKADGRIDWQDSARDIFNRVRGLFPWPGAYTYFRDRTVKFLQVAVVSDDFEPAAPGAVVALSNETGPVIATGDGYLRILRIQPPNKRPMACSDFCRGYHLAVGDRFGAGNREQVTSNREQGAGSK